MHTASVCIYIKVVYVIEYCHEPEAPIYLPREIKVHLLGHIVLLYSSYIVVYY